MRIAIRTGSMSTTNIQASSCRSNDKYFCATELGDKFPRHVSAGG